MPELPHGETLGDLLTGLVRGHGNDVALIEEGAPVTFCELEADVGRLAAGLAHHGVGRGDAVAIWLPNGTPWVQLTFALARLGAVAVGVNTRYRSRELLHVLRVSGATALVVQPGFKGVDFAGMLAEATPDLPDSLRLLVTVGTPGPTPGPPITAVDHGALLDHDLPPTSDAATPDLPGNAFSSSGTTGDPKLVLHSQAGIVAHSRAVAETFGYREPGSRVLAALPLCGVFGFDTAMATLAAGGTVVLAAEFVAEDVVATMRRVGVTHANLADEMLRRLVELPGALETLPAWRECGFGAFTAIDPHDLVAAGDRAGKRFFQTYGSSEVQALMTYPPPGAGPERRSLGGGVPCHPDVEVRVRDDDGQLCDLGEPGEIEVRGPNVTCGYYGLTGVPDQDAEGFFRTGDLGAAGAGRDVVYLSRRGDVLRLAGFLVSPREIEAFLEEQPGVEGAQVVGVDLGTDTAPVAFLTACPGAAIDVEAVLAAARRDLARFKVPRLVEVLEAFPLADGTNGVKIQRTVLRDRARVAWDFHRPEKESRR